jgi:hypothetical protein
MSGSDRVLGARHGGAPVKPKPAQAFTFDRVFGAGATQAEVYSAVDPLVQSVLSGYNATVFAYGATGSGKTHTMMGTDADPGVWRRAR